MNADKVFGLKPEDLKLGWWYYVKFPRRWTFRNPDDVVVRLGKLKGWDGDNLIFRRRLRLFPQQVSFSAVVCLGMPPLRVRIWRWLRNRLTGE